MTMYFLSPEDRDPKTLFGAVTARTMWGEKMLLSLVELPAHSVVPMHSHPHEQVGIVLEGNPTFIVGGEERTLKPGDMYVIPGGVEHSVLAGDSDGKALDVFSPVREDYQY
ncbi:MAG: cupin domain-containing protein [Litorilinea sp.]